MDKKIGIILEDNRVNQGFIRSLIRMRDSMFMCFIIKSGQMLSDVKVSGGLLNQIPCTESLSDLFSMDYIFFFVDKKIKKDDENLIRLKHSFKGVLYIISESIQGISAALKGEDLQECIVLSFPELSMEPFIEILQHGNLETRNVNESVDLLKYLGYNTLIIKNDIENGVIDRLQLTFINSALLILKKGFKVSTIDACLKFRLGLTHGIFQLADMYGIDKIFKTYKNMGFHVPDIIEKMYREKKFGKSAGIGFYNYSTDIPIIPDDEIYKINPYDMISPVVNVAANLLEICEPDDIDKFFAQEYGSTEGIISIADGMGINHIVENLHENYKNSGDSLFMASTKLTDMVDKNFIGIESGVGFYRYNYNESNFGPVRYCNRDRYTYIIMNRPEALNALNEKMWKGLKLAIEKANNDDKVVSIIVTGTGRSFSAGDDIKMMSEWNNSVDASLWLDQYANPLIDTITGCAKPIISVVDGIAFGGGCELNMLFDIVIASNRSIFSVPEGLIGALPPVAASYGIALTGRKLFRYLLTSEWINAHQAKDLGFVDLVVPPEQLPFLIYEFTEKIRKNAPMSVTNTKRLINTYKENFKALERLAGSYLVINAGSEDFKNRQKAFLNKQKIKWRGK